MDSTLKWHSVRSSEIDYIAGKGTENSKYSATPIIRTAITEHFVRSLEVRIIGVALNSNLQTKLLE